MKTASRAVSSETQGHVARLFGRDAAYLVLWATQLLCAALFTPALTRVLGVTQFGTVTTANATMQVIFIVAGFGLQTAAQREYAANSNPLGARRLLGFAIAGALLVSAAAWLTIGLWSKPMGLTHETRALQLAVLWAGSSAITNVSLGLLRSQDRLAAFCAVSLLQSVLAEALSLTYAWVGHASAEDFLWGQVIAQLAAVVLGLCLAPPAMIRAADRKLLERALRYGLPLVPSVLSTFVLSTSDRLIVQAQLGSEAVARYQIAYNVAAMPMLLLSVLSATWMPRLFGIADDSERHDVLRVSRDALYRLMVPVIVGFACGAPLVLRIWAPAQYRPDQLRVVVSIILITVVPFAAQLAMSRTLMAQGRTGVIALATFIGAAANVALNLWLIPPLGLTGSALATLLAYGVLYAVLALGGRGAPIGPPPRKIQAQLAVATGLALAVTGVAATGPLLALRGLAGLLAVPWFLRIAVRTGQKPRPAAPVVASGARADT